MKLNGACTATLFIGTASIYTEGLATMHSENYGPRWRWRGRLRRCFQIPCRKHIEIQNNKQRSTFVVLGIQGQSRPSFGVMSGEFLATLSYVATGSIVERCTSLLNRIGLSSQIPLVSSSEQQANARQKAPFHNIIHNLLTSDKEGLLKRENTAIARLGSSVGPTAHLFTQQHDRKFLD